MKLKTIISLLLIITISFQASKAQEKEKRVDKEKDEFFHISGLTLSDSTHSIPYVHIIFKKRNLATASDIRGYFNFPAQVTDTLVFSAIGYKLKTIVVGDYFSKDKPVWDIILETDTIQIEELVITPWQGNYERFRQAVLAYVPPTTDMDKALKNLAILDMETLLYNSPATPTTAFRNTMKGYNDKLYWAGQLPPINITNPLAWAQFFKALKDGDFKRKK